MNTMFLAILAIASTIFITGIEPPATITSSNITVGSNLELPINHSDQTQPAWAKSAIDWLIEAQAPNGGWGAGSHSYQNVRDPHLVQTDPATTSFAAMALLKSGGALKDNPYEKQIMKALDRILTDIESRPNNGRITSLDGTQPQVKLGIHIDASMALQFLTEMSDQLTDAALQKKVDDAAKVCIQLIQGSQNVDGGWAGGGWAPVLQSAMANNALERAQVKYDVDARVIENSRKYQADNMSGENVRSEDAAGVPLYAAASAQRATSAEAREAEKYFDTTISQSYSSGKADEKDLVKVLESKGIEKSKAERLANSYAVNQSSSKVLRDENIWEGFGNNGGEEYLSYLMTSEALAQQNKEEWLKWKQSIEPKFKQSQNPNGSWSGHHCITSPVFCTAAIVQAWNAGI